MKLRYKYDENTKKKKEENWHRENLRGTASWKTRLENWPRRVFGKLIDKILEVYSQMRITSFKILALSLYL